MLRKMALVRIDQKQPLHPRIIREAVSHDIPQLVIGDAEYIR